MKAVPTIAVRKIKMMQASILCLTLGLLGLLPLIGLPFALAAAWVSGRVRVQEKNLWNAAKPQRILGFTCAVIGAVTWTLVDAFLIYRAIYGSGQS